MSEGRGRGLGLEGGRRGVGWREEGVRERGEAGEGWRERK